MQVIYEDNHIIAVNKAVGEIVQSDKTGDPTLADEVKQYIKEKYGKPGDVFLGVVHRIDRPVSGVVLFARTSKALARLNKMFADKTIKKYYWAITQERPAEMEAELHHYIGKDEEKNRAKVSVSQRTGYKEAVLRYKTIGASERLYCLEVELLTGRHHQIRAQLARAGMPIRGDLKYGAKRSNEGGGINLHSRRLEFEHPVSHEQIVIEAPLPDDRVWALFGK
ncbi:MAG: RluA family pseudouridine synthase [Bacteroidales bacterium]|jgi:23S rRNA pseudouridine1911/1915/1917 synthase|nr:RluA family pseudouridine synthase [Bacteroidales bacterium]